MENNLDNAKDFFMNNNFEFFTKEQMNVIGKTMRDYHNVLMKEKNEKNMNFPRINNLLENIKSLEKFKTESGEIKNMQTTYDEELLNELEDLLIIKSNDETLINFIDWFGTWQTNNRLEDYGINDILEAYKRIKN